MLYTPLQVGLPSAKNIKFIVSTWVLSSSECTKTRFGRRFAPDPAGGAYDAPPDPLVGWGWRHPFPIPLSPRRLRSLDLAAIPLFLKEIYANVCDLSNDADRYIIYGLMWSTTVSIALSCTVFELFHGHVD